MKFLIVILCICILLTSTLVILAVLSIFVRWKWFCNILGWHKAPKEREFDGCSYHGICPVCGRAVMRDGQGNWF